MQAYKQWLNIADDPDCEWCQASETIEHYFFECLLFLYRLLEVPAFGLRSFRVL